MKQIRLTQMAAVCAMATCLFASCASDDALQSSTKGEALTFSVGLNAVSPMEIDTRSVRFDTDTIFAGVMHSKEVEVSMGEISRAPLDDTPTWVGGEAVTVQVDGRFFQYTIGGSGSSSTMSSAAPYYFTNLNSLTANAWYPSTNGAVVGTTHSVSASQNNDANFKNSDFLYGSASVVHSNTTNSISLSHKIAKVRVTVNVANPSYLANSTINSVVLSGTKRDGTVGSNGVLSVSGDASDITMHKQSDNVFEACIIPQNASLTFKVNVGGTIYTAQTLTPRDYAANNVYRATINISASKFLYQGNTSVDIGDFYGIYANGQGVVIDNTSASVSAAIAKGITPVGIVYSTTTSDIDKGHGWTNGYCFALKEVGSYAWSTNTTTTVLSKQYPWVTPIDYTYFEDWDGYTYTHQVTDNSNYNSSTYPALFAAVNYQNTCKLSNATSKWYLPMFGQWYYLYYNLGSSYSLTLRCSPVENFSYDESGVHQGWWLYQSAGSNLNCSRVVAIALNEKMSIVGSEYYTAFPVWEDVAHNNRYYWTSGEASASNPVYTVFEPNSNLAVLYTARKKTVQCDVRPAFAF